MFSNSLMVMKDGPLLCGCALVLCFGVQLYNIEEKERKHRKYYVKTNKKERNNGRHAESPSLAIFLL
ncbi:hypothetical protein QL285_020832 [Trifolium repens]|nr:hypothetical protein QL285_020832 [Trifolium repens]